MKISGNLTSIETVNKIKQNNKMKNLQILLAKINLAISQEVSDETAEALTEIRTGLEEISEKTEQCENLLKQIKDVIVDSDSMAAESLKESYPELFDQINKIV